MSCPGKSRSSPRSLPCGDKQQPGPLTISRIAVPSGIKTGGVLIYYFSIELFHSIEKTPPDGVVESMIFGIENHRYPSHYDLHIKMFHSAE